MVSPLKVKKEEPMELKHSKLFSPSPEKKVA